jgi:hypothetical protein
VNEEFRIDLEPDLGVEAEEIHCRRIDGGGVLVKWRGVAELVCSNGEVGFARYCVCDVEDELIKSPGGQSYCTSIKGSLYLGLQLCSEARRRDVGAVIKNGNVIFMIQITC